MLNGQESLGFVTLAWIVEVVIRSVVGDVSKWYFTMVSYIY